MDAIAIRAVHLAVLGDLDEAGREQLCAVMAYDGVGHPHLHPLTPTTPAPALPPDRNTVRRVGRVSFVCPSTGPCRSRLRLAGRGGPGCCPRSRPHFAVCRPTGSRPRSPGS